MNEQRDQLGLDVQLARANERDSRFKAQNLEQAAAVATKEWQRAVKIRERAELWHQAEVLRRELAEVENKAAGITI